MRRLRTGTSRVSTARLRQETLNGGYSRRERADGDHRPGGRRVGHLCLRQQLQCEAASVDHQGGDEASYNAVGDVIHYTIVATNDGNIDARRRDGDRPERRSRLALHAGQRLAAGAGRVDECTASHTVTQADIDAGSYFNQACVDRRRTGGACDGVCRVPALPRTRIWRSRRWRRRRATTRSVDVIHYTIVATNDGNMTLAAT